MKPRHLVIATVAVALILPTIAVASGEGQSILGGQRNPTLSPSRTYSGETQIIAKNSTYGTRQSNMGTGGGAIYGCRAVAGSTASCLRGVNLNQGTAFDFSTNGVVGGKINTAGGDKARPFITNATGVATGLNADRVDSKSADELTADATTAATAAATTAATTAAAANNQTAQVSDTGTLSKARGATAATRDSEGVFDVTFAKDVSACLPTATLVNTTGGQISVSPTSATVIRVTTRDIAGAVDDSGFSLLVTC